MKEIHCLTLGKKVESATVQVIEEIILQSEDPRGKKFRK